VPALARGDAAPAAARRRGRRERPSPSAPPLAGAAARTAGLWTLIALTLLGSVASLALGSVSIPVADTLDALFAYDPTSENQIIVRELRGPRTVAALLVGGALGIAGALMQGLTRNPLADPGLLGVNAGASLAVVLAIYLLDVTAFNQYIWFAFAGAAVAAVAVYVLGTTKRGGATPVRLALAGAAVTAFLTSVTSGILIYDRLSLEVFRFWTVGSLGGRSWDLVVNALPFIGAGIVLALLTGKALNALNLGEDVAKALGQNVARTRIALAAIIVVLAGAGVSIAGPIVFLGLAVPHIARGLVGPDYRWVVPYSALLACVLLLVADILGRVLISPRELPVGVMLVLIGGPFFVYLVRRRKLVQL
jgi:iron complex transport system permease protein